MLALLLAGPLLGMLFFGAVRFFIAGPLILVVLAGGILLLLRSSFYPEVRRIQVPPGGWVWIAFLAYAAARIPFSASPYEARIEWFSLFTCVLAYWAFADVAGAGRRWRVVFGVTLFAITLLGWYAIVQNARGSSQVLWLPRPEGYGMRASATYFCPNHFASLAAVGLCLGLTLLLLPDAGLPLRLLGGYALLVLPYPLVLTQSRSGMIGAAVGLGVTGVLAAWRRSRRLAVLIAVLAPLLATGAGVTVWALSPVNRARFERALQGEDVRPTLWRNTVNMIADRPLLGFGGGSYRFVQGRYQTYTATHRARYAHNEFLHLTAEYGVVGFVLFSAFVAVLLGRLVRLVHRARKPRNAVLAAGTVGAVAAALAHAFFDYNLHILANALVLVMLAGTVAGVFFASGDLSAWFPRPAAARAFRWTGVALAAGIWVWTLASLLAALLCFPAARAVDRMESRRGEQGYRLATHLDPGNWEPWLEIAKIRRLQAYFNPVPEYKQQFYGEAMALYRRCLKANPWQMEALYGEALIAQRRGRPEEALRILREIVDRVPRHVFYRIELGRQLRAMGREHEALAEFKEAARLNPRDEVARAQIRSLQRRGIK